MAALADRKGARWDWSIPEGVTFTPVVRYYRDGTLCTTISSATMTIALGTSAAPSTSFQTPTVTIGSTTTMTFTLTATNTRAFVPGTDYTYALVATLADGSVVRVAYGDIEVKKEVGT